MKFLKYAALLVALCFASPAFALTGTCYWVAGTSYNNSSDWAATTGGVGGTCVSNGVSGIPKAAGDIAKLDANSPAATTLLADIDLSIATIDLSALTGSSGFDGNGHNITLSTSLLGSGTGTRSFTMGSGTWTITPTGGTGWDFSTVTNLTLTTTGSTLLIQPASTAGSVSIVLGASETYNTVTVGPVSSGSWIMFSSTSTTITTFNITGPAHIGFLGGSTQTITNAVAWTGTSSSPIAIDSSNASGQATTVHLSAASTADWVSFARVTFNTSSMTATDCLNFGGVTFSGGGSCTAPVVGTGGGFIIGG